MLTASPEAGSRRPARFSGHPKIWQLHEVPCWDRILLEIFEYPRPACMGYVSVCSPSVLVLYMSSSPDCEQVYDIVYRDAKTEAAYLLEVLYVELCSFEQLALARRLRSRLPTRPPQHAPPVNAAVESPHEHQWRGRCPFCHGSKLKSG